MGILATYSDGTCRLVLKHQKGKINKVFASYAEYESFVKSLNKPANNTASHR